ncbi:MAG TPA: hypothetical protein PKO16_08985, partial [Bacteroidia bacterium]|nr:hypothetical protein [Bacteroidia bacterium]
QHRQRIMLLKKFRSSAVRTDNNDLLREAAPCHALPRIKCGASLHVVKEHPDLLRYGDNLSIFGGSLLT